MNTVEALTKARDLIADPARWTQGCLSRDASGAEAPDEVSVCWCALGALDHVTGELMPDGPTDALYEALGCASIAEFNDTRTHAEVLALFNKAIATESAKAGGA